VNYFGGVDDYTSTLSTLQLTIQDNEGRTYSSFNFSQDSENFCTNALDCLIVQSLHHIGKSDAYFILNITTLDEKCQGLTNSYTENICKFNINER